MSSDAEPQRYSAQFAEMVTSHHEVIEVEGPCGHHEVIHSDKCAEDDLPWPCDTRKVLDLYRDLRMAFCEYIDASDAVPEFGPLNRMASETRTAILNREREARHRAFHLLDREGR